jgi:hypothetical protein
VTNNSPLKTTNKNHLAIAIPSPAEYCASTRQCTRVKLRASRWNSIIPLKTQIWQHERHRSSHIDSKLYFTQSTASRESQNTSYPAQGKRCDATVQANSSHGRISVGSSVIADLQASQVISPKYISSETQNSPSNKTASITWPRWLRPQQKTVPLLDIAQE